MSIKWSSHTRLEDVERLGGLPADAARVDEGGEGAGAGPQAGHAQVDHEGDSAPPVAGLRVEMIYYLRIIFTLSLSRQPARTRPGERRMSPATASPPAPANKLFDQSTIT
jgi:hypothetical protein